MTSSLVAIYKSDDYTLSDVEKVIGRIFSNYPEFIKRIRGCRVLIKPNLIFPDPPEKLSCTHPTVVEAVIRLILEHGGHPALGDRPIKGSARKVAKDAGILEICKKYDVPIIEFKKFRKVAFPKVGRFSSLSICREIDDFDLILNLPKLKVHAQLLITCAVKNIFGCVSLSQRVLMHLMTNNRDIFTEFLIHACLSIRPAFSLVDAIIIMHKDGPRGGIPYKLGVLLGGDDPFYVDAAVAKILNLKIESIPIMELAQRLGIFYPDQIQTIGVPIGDIICTDLKLPRLQPVNFDIYRSGTIACRQLLASRFNLFRKKDKTR